MPNATDIVAYTYQAETLCPSCVVPVCVAQALRTDQAVPLVQTHSTEKWLDTVALSRGIDREDERSFDSGDFPKVVFADQIEHTAIDVPDDSFIGQGFRAPRCDSCGKELI